MTEKKKSERDIATEYQAGATVVDEGISFKIPFWFGTKLKLTIRPIRGGTLVKMSMQVTKLKPINENESMVQEMLRSADNIRPICRIIALGCLTRSQIKTKLFAGILTNILLWKVESMEEMFAYLSIVYRQMSPQHFFFIMALTKGMNWMERKNDQEKTGEAKPFGGQ